ncbi:hypothetical protein WME73_14940 [Sorangium sp. So ce302]|uniref:hypothetical protein n=1 Tax=Sorangium sp. So ce302 TaxID=3133297 RepID=UPI003F639CFA
MTTQELVEQFIELGRTKGMARATIELYEARFGAMPPPLRLVVEAMRDLPTLRAWHLLAGTGTREDVHEALRRRSLRALRPDPHREVIPRTGAPPAPGWPARRPRGPRRPRVMGRSASTTRRAGCYRT